MCALTALLSMTFDWRGGVVVAAANAVAPEGSRPSCFGVAGPRRRRDGGSGAICYR